MSTPPALRVQLKGVPHLSVAERVGAEVRFLMNLRQALGTDDLVDAYQRYLCVADLMEDTDLTIEQVDAMANWERACNAAMAVALARLQPCPGARFRLDY
jgi:hypothetical protein